MPDTPRVYVVDDDEAMCKSMKFLITSVGLDAVIFNSSKEFIDTFDDEKASCVLLDIRMPEYSGLEIQEILNERGVKIPIIFITSHKDIHVAVKAMKAGALDFLTKPFSEQQLLDMIHKAIQLNAKWRESQKDIQSIKKSIALLSKREKEVLELVVQGKMNKVMSADLGISSKTVELHRAKIMKKMEARSLAELVRMVVTYKAQLQKA